MCNKLLDYYDRPAEIEYLRGRRKKRLKKKIHQGRVRLGLGLREKQKRCVYIGISHFGPFGGWAMGERMGREGGNLATPQKKISRGFFFLFFLWVERTWVG